VFRFGYTLLRPTGASGLARPPAAAAASAFHLFSLLLVFVGASARSLARTAPLHVARGNSFASLRHVTRCIRAE